MSNLPEHLKFTPTHEWLNCSAEEMVVGITEHAQELLGDMVFVELPEVGTVVAAGDELGVLESVKAASDFYAPISGIVVAVNQCVSDKAELVNRSPYDEGWLVKMKATNKDEINNLLNEAQYQQEINKDH